MVIHMSYKSVLINTLL